MFGVSESLFILSARLPSTLLCGVSIFVIFFLLGLSLGSFAQAASLRLNCGEDIIFRRSRCRSCGVILGLAENLPLVGWLLSMGRCGECGARFGIRYLLIEIVMGILVGLLFTFYAFPMASLLTLGVTLAMICALTDFDEMSLHLPVMVALGALGLMSSFLGAWPVSPLSAMGGMASVVGLVLVVNLIYRVMRGESGFGSGDYWLLGALGFWLGPFLSIVLFFVSAALGSVVGVGLILCGRGSGRTSLPFGVFISIVFILWPVLNILSIFW